MPTLLSVAHALQPIVDTHRNAQSRYTDATEGPNARRLPHALALPHPTDQLLLLSHQPNEEIASRCETVLNTTMAEMEIYHTQKAEDFASIAKEHLDGEIEFYEQVRMGLPPTLHLTLTFSLSFAADQVLNRLRTARRTFEPPIYPRLVSASRQPSIYERDLERPRLNPDPLPQPCPHVFDSTPMRPVSHAIQEGVGLLLGSATNVVTGRGSMFGKFW